MAASKRLSVSIPVFLYRKLEERSVREDRSLSSLVAYLLEKSLEEKGNDQSR